MAASTIVITRRAQSIQIATNELNAISRSLGVELPPFPRRKWPNQAHADADRMYHIATVLGLIRQKVAPDSKPGPIRQPTFKPAQPIKNAPTDPTAAEPAEEEMDEQESGEEVSKTDTGEANEIQDIEFTKDELKYLRREKEGKKLFKDPEHAGHKLDYWEDYLNKKKAKTEGEARNAVMEVKGVGQTTAGQIIADLKHRRWEREVYESAKAKQKEQEAREAATETGEINGGDQE